tara:strand:- start:3413 stop:3904 length:492 start_codon:yes stop_codon:yes gene_type:complete
MATTVKNATLTVTIEEEITLNGSRQGAKNVKRISNINEIYKRIVSCPGTDTRVVDFHSSVSDAVLTPLDVQDVLYIRLTNLDDANSVVLSLQMDPGEDDTDANYTTSIKLSAGESFIMGSPHDGVSTSDSSISVITDLIDLESIIVSPQGNTVDVEVFVASSV